MKRRALIIALVVLAALALAPEALAAAGGGSYSYGGGEGGGGGGGRGAGLYILIQILIRVAIFGHGLGVLIILGLVVLAVLYVRLAPRFRKAYTAHEEQGPAARRQVAKRQRRVELAAAEAAEDDPAFAPDAVRGAATKLFKDVQAAWDSDDRDRLRGLLGADLLAEWNRRLDDFKRRGWRNRVQVLDEPSVEYVSLVHRGTAEDRVVVRIEARLQDYVEDHQGNRIKRAGRLSQTVTLREYWTLLRVRSKASPQQWMLGSIEQGGEGRHALEEQIVAMPWSDEQGMRDESLVEGAVAEAVPAGTRIAEVADLQFEGEAHAAALDLSLADGRFAPDVLEVAARRTVGAWAQAVDGDDAPLAALADPDAVLDLLHPGDPTGQTRLVVRGPRVKRIKVVGLDAAAAPPTMTVEVDVEGRRYLEDRDTTAVVAGSRSRQVSFTERWRFALTDDPRQPWRISDVLAETARL
ncbi:MAG: TIM44-like domain-containing protein [Solirubrobacteraceae bacterium]